jgi:adenylate cyclase
MQALIQHWRRIAFTLIPLVFALLHAAGSLPIDLLNRLDNVIYDLRLRATMPNTLDERIVIVDIDEKSLAELGHWPWGRNQLATLMTELFERQQVAQVGFDVFFTEADESSGLKNLQRLARTDLQSQPGFADKVLQLEKELDYDALFASALRDKPVVMGFFLSRNEAGRVAGVLPQPVMEQSQLLGRPIGFTHWNGYGASIAALAKAAPMAGHANHLADSDGVVRSVPLLAEYQGKYYESLSLAMFRLLIGLPTVSPGFPPERYLQRSYAGLASIDLHQGNNALAIPVDKDVATLVPFRGPGGVTAGSYRYVSATDLLLQRVPARNLQDKIILIGTTAAGLLDLRVTPVGETYPGVEVHANLLSGLLDGRMLVRPDYAAGFEVVQLLLTGLLLAIALPMLSAPRAVALSAIVLAALLGANLWVYSAWGLVLPLASALVVAITAFALNMSYGYFVESRSKRELAQLFGTYVPPELVDEMVKDPDAYSMQAVNRELTVMFCDMRGFTQMSESMEPTQLQTLLNAIFSRLTQCIRVYRGTIDKYMGDCVMAFWGAPVAEQNHASLAVKAALEMAQAVRTINLEHQASGAAPIGIGIGLNSGSMCVGDMGSDIRRSYTVVGDAVNLGSRLEGLSKTYGVDIVASEATRSLAPEFVWQELDRVRVKGKQQAVAIFTPRGLVAEQGEEQAAELKLWGTALRAYRKQDWDACDVHLLNLQRLHADKYLYALYVARVSSHRALPFDAAWDGATNFDTK